MGYIENLNEIMSIKEQLKANLGLQSDDFAMYPELIDKTVEDIALDYDMAKNYLTIEVLEVPESYTAEFYIKMDSGLTTTNLEYIAYSKNDADFTIIMNQTNQSVNTLIDNLSVGDKIRICGKGLCLDGFHITGFGCSYYPYDSQTSFKIYGNIMSLVNENNFENTNPTVELQFYGIFNGYGDTAKLYADQLVLPSTLTARCFEEMFMESGIVTPPQLPATTLTNRCYYRMFYKCGDLAYVPQLPATTTFSSDSCKGMFTQCNSLKSLPYLSATTLPWSAYQSMFLECTGITIVDCFPDEMTLRSSESLKLMFMGCTGITYIKDLVFASSQSASLDNTFAGCTRLVNGPIIYLKDSSGGTISLYTTFKDCSNLKRFGLIIEDSDDYSNFNLNPSNVSSYGTVIVNPKAYNISSIPSGWSIGRYFRTDNRICQYFDTYDDLLASVSLANGYINTESLSMTNADYNALFDTSALLATSVIKAQIYDNNTLTEQSLSYSASGEASVTVSLTAGQVVKLYAGTTSGNGEYWINAFSTADEGSSYLYTVQTTGNYIITTHAGTNKPYFTVTAV